ncbi:MAG: c-type cytochrome [Verrucomicrobiota bacterium]|nr:c-type cytochrome [Verrucomicrobiota bacterium]MDP6252165.1 c-type cytochrome [Verrucomicrobiota bacterium]MDP7178407.1 c-type cytochrome [Verrucomicrobiota bacterium]MDP7291706.1 c-type cytochrome [Verrucomicrobiota bacterium]HJN82658.1 c-type cytochrome [Verrucomicrobiota bacterium]
MKVRRWLFLGQYTGLASGLWLVAVAGCVQGPSEAESPLAATALGQVDTATIDACMVCHSTREMQRGPVLDGFPEWYLADQLKKFKAGHRGKNKANRAEALMGTAMAKVGTDEQLAALARHFAGRKPKASIRVVRGDIPVGRVHYATRCASCHGAGGGGMPEIQSPPVNVQEDWFLLDQLRKYANGQRTVHPSDAGGVLMKAAAAALSPDDLRSVVAYIAKDLTVTPPLQKVGPPKK